MLTGTVPFSDDLPAVLLPERPGWSAGGQVWQLDLFVGVTARLETVDGQDLDATEQVFASTRGWQAVDQ